MSQNKKTFNLCLLLFSFTFFLSLTGCMTLAVSQFIQHQRPSWEEMYFLPKNKTFTTGEYLGTSNVKGVSYARIKIQPAMEGCMEKDSEIDLLLPMSKNTDAKVIYRSGFYSKELILFKDKYTGQPVKIIYYSHRKTRK